MLAGSIRAQIMRTHPVLVTAASSARCYTSSLHVHGNYVQVYAHRLICQIGVWRQGRPSSAHHLGLSGTLEDIAHDEPKHARATLHLYGCSALGKDSSTHVTVHACSRVEHLASRQSLLHALFTMVYTANSCIETNFTTIYTAADACQWGHFKGGSPLRSRSTWRLG